MISLTVLVLALSTWRYQPGDNLAWAQPDFDDSQWHVLTDTRFTARELPTGGGPGTGWFRVHVRVEDEDALAPRGLPLALALDHWGASDIYVDGHLVQRFAFNPRGRPIVAMSADGYEHVLAIRLSGPPLGFSATLSNANDSIDTFERHVARDTGLNLGFGGLFIAFGLLHALLFAFYPRERGNLFFAMFAVAVAAVMGIDFARQLGHHSLQFQRALLIALPATGVIYCASFLAFLYTSTSVARSRLFPVYCAAWVVTVLLYVWPPLSPAGDLLSVLLLLLFALECLRIAGTVLLRRDEGAAIVAIGALGSLVTPVTVALEIAGLPIPLYSENVASRFAFLLLILSASFYLARRVARTNTRLEATLAEVRELAARQLEQERERAEHRRRLKELEDARELQLSMLPQQLPSVPSLDIAAYMKTATEVGGDYYDFHLSPDGTLTIVVGDATGHGLRAGTVVTATKSLFQAFAAERDLPNLFGHSARTLEQMNLGSLFMALQVLKIKDGTMKIAAAGMPPAAIYRAKSGTVEQVTAAGPPLGLPIPWQYEEETYTLSPGDAVLLMTDGIPERFDPQEEMFGYSRVAELLTPASSASCAGATAQQIVEQVVQSAESWAKGRPQDDDVTVLVVRVRERAD